MHASKKFSILSIAQKNYLTYFCNCSGVQAEGHVAPRSSLLRRSSHFGYEGRKLRGYSVKENKLSRINTYSLKAFSLST